MHNRVGLSTSTWHTFFPFSEAALCAYFSDKIKPRFTILNKHKAWTELFLCKIYVRDIIYFKNHFFFNQDLMTESLQNTIAMCHVFKNDNIRFVKWCVTLEVSYCSLTLENGIIISWKWDNPKIFKKMGAAREVATSRNRREIPWRESGHLPRLCWISGGRKGL